MVPAIKNNWIAGEALRMGDVVVERPGEADDWVVYRWRPTMEMNEIIGIVCEDCRPGRVPAIRERDWRFPRKGRMVQ